MPASCIGQFRMFLVILVFLVWAGYKVYERLFPAPFIKPAGKVVVVTGCDTGFGRMLSVELDKKGYTVIAGCYSESSLKELSGILTNKDAAAVRLDITNPDHVKNIAEFVRGRTNQIHALVNNAGINEGSICEWTSMDLYQRVFQVNVFGGIAMTKAFLPLLTKGQGRVVNVTSVAGFMAAPGLSAYVASKFAFEGFSDSIRRELAPWGVKVSCIEPGFMSTPLVMGAQQQQKRLWDSLDASVRARWGEEYFAKFHKNAGAIAANSENPMKAVQAMLHAIGSTKPQIRYRPGIQAKVFTALALLPAWVLDRFIALGEKRNGEPAGLVAERAERLGTEEKKSQ